MSGEGWGWDRRWTATVTTTDRRDRIARLLQRRLRSLDRIARSEQQTKTLSQIARSPFRVIIVNARTDRTFCKEERLSIVWLIDFQTQRMWFAMSVCVQSIVNCKFQTEKNEWERTWRVSGSSEIGFKMCEENKRKKRRRLYNKTSPKKMGLMVAWIKRGLSPAQKKYGNMSIKCGLRAGLRPRVKNAAGN